MQQMGGDDTTGPLDAVTRADTSADLGMSGLSASRDPAPLAPIVASAQDATALADPTGPLSIEMMYRTIVSEYRRPVTGDRLRRVASQTGGVGDGMRQLTDGVLAGLGATRPAPQETGTELASAAQDAPASLNALIVQAMREGQTDAYVDALLNEAVGSGDVTAPEALVTSSGEVDTATLLDSLVQQSTATPTAASATPTIGTKSAAALPDTAPLVDETLTYDVQPGDSLAGIALRHFGTTTAYEIIYHANRDQLPTPGAVRPGMTLVIPGL